MEIDFSKISEAVSTTIDEADILEREEAYAALAGDPGDRFAEMMAGENAESRPDYRGCSHEAPEISIETPDLSDTAKALQESLDCEAPEITSEGFVLFPQTFVDLDENQPGFIASLKGDKEPPTPPPTTTEKACQWGHRVARIPTQELVLRQLDGLATLAPSIHKMSVEKGWWDNPLDTDNIGAKLQLVISELSEATEAARDGAIEIQTVYGKPEGFVVEMADAVIRLLDLMAAIGAGLDFGPNEYMLEVKCPNRPQFLDQTREISVNRALRAINFPVRLISMATEEIEVEHRYEDRLRSTILFGILLRTAIFAIAEICVWLGVDLKDAINIKHSFNATRTHRHGGRLA